MTSTTAAEAAPMLEELRLQAWSDFQSCPVPPRSSEFWRRVDFARWRLEELGPQAAGGEAPAVALARGGAAGVLRQAGSSPEAATDLDAALAAKGVVLSSLERAFSTHPQLVRQALARSGAPEIAKLEAANAALWRGGAFLYVPPGMKIERPFDIAFAGGSGHRFPRLVAVFGEGCEATVIEDHSEGAAVSVAFGRLLVGEGARLHYFYNQGLPEPATHFWSQRVDLARDARLRHYSVLMGAALHKSDLRVELLGPGARSELYGLLFGSARQLFDAATWQMHRAPHTQSDLLFKSALKDRARSVYTGMIRIEKAAIGSNAFQQNNNLLLSEGARADTTPILEILTDQVRCKHGATMGPVSAEELFYLACRGYEPAEAAQALVMGFFDPILKEMPLDRLKAALPARVQRALSEPAAAQESAAL